MVIATSALLLGVFAFFALLFLIALPWHPYPGSLVVKAVPALSLALLAWLRGPEEGAIFLALGLLFAAGGDIALDLERTRGGTFILGLALFLVTQLLYAVAFSRAGLDSGRWPLPLMLLLYGAGFMFLLWPHLGKMRGPVVAYMVVIMLMGITAVLRPGSWLVPLGALFFIASDSTIAYDRFVRPLPANRYLVMGSYYAAQLLITLGMIPTLTA